MQYHPTVEKIKTLLASNNTWFETFEHKPVRTSEEAAKLRTGYTQQQGAKALIVRIKKKDGAKEFVMIVLPGDKRFDNEKAKEVLGAKDIRFATEEEISEITQGIEIGGIPP
ncbi:MAG: YbaK/EbsC family protein, partial [Candidatus Levyibacteriota bacterium]